MYTHVPIVPRDGAPILKPSHGDDGDYNRGLPRVSGGSLAGGQGWHRIGTTHGEGVNEEMWPQALIERAVCCFDTPEMPRLKLISFPRAQLIVKRRKPRDQTRLRNTKYRGIVSPRSPHLISLKLSILQSSFCNTWPNRKAVLSPEHLGFD